MSLPAVKAMKDHMPEARISWLVEGAVGEFLRHQPFIDEVISFPRARLSRELRSGRFSAAGHTLGEFLSRLRAHRYDLILDFHGIAKSTLLAYAARGQTRVGLDRMFAKEWTWLAYGERVGGVHTRLHKVDRNMLFPRYLGVDGGVPSLELRTGHAAEDYIERFCTTEGLTGPFFTVNPFCSKGSDAKRWDIENYAGLIRRIRDAFPVELVVLWGPGEREEAERLVAMSDKAARLACPTDVSQLFALVRRARLYIGGDTGVMHLAAFAGTPVVSIFGPTDHRINAPYGERHAVLRKELSCSPCRDKGKGCAERTCLGSMSVDEVYDAVRASWERMRGN